MPTETPGLTHLVGWMGIAPETWGERARLLLKVPGVKPAQKPLPSGWLVPRNVVLAGTRGASLADYSEGLEGSEPWEYRAPSGLELHGHQMAAVAFVCGCVPTDEGCLIGGKAGSGKTIIALQSTMLSDPNWGTTAFGPLLIVGTKRARSAWVGPNADPAKHYGLSVEPLETEVYDEEKLKRHRALFIHYDVLDAWKSALYHLLQPKWIIFDESHHLAHATSLRSGAAKYMSLCPSVQRRVLLTGSPIPNKRADLYHQLVVAQPRQWGANDNLFLESYCGRRWTISDMGTEYPVDDEENVSDDAIRELRARLAGVLLRFDAEVEGLPDLEVERVELNLDDTELAANIRRAMRDFAKYLRSIGQMPAAETLTITIGGRELTLSAKDQMSEGWRLKALTTVIGLLSEYKARRAVPVLLELLKHEEKLVVFTWRVAPADGLYHALRDEFQVATYGPLDGRMDQEERQSQAEAFARHEGQAVCVATIGGAGESVNELSAARVGLAVDLHYQPAAIGQMVSRLHRDGGPHRKIKFIFLIVRNTIDEELMAQFEAKVEAAKRTLVGEGNVRLADIDVDPMDTPTLDGLWSSLQRIPTDD